jgi:phosphate:Na+ symporter
MAHIVFNICSGLAAFVLLYPLVAASHWLADITLADSKDEPLTLAIFNTLLNCLGVLLIWPFADRLVRWLQTLYVSEDETIARPVHLDPTLAAVPSVALRGLVLEIQRMMDIAFGQTRIRLAALPGQSVNGGIDMGVIALGQAIRDFIAELSRQPLPREVVDALPDLIRSIHHVEEVVSEVVAISVAAHPPLNLITGPNWVRLQSSVVAAFQMRTKDPDEFKSAFDQEMNAVEEAYETIKRDLLEAAAAGKVPVESMEAALLRARRMRRVAEAALKAERRLSPWGHIGSDKVETSPDPEPASGAA